jgi:translation initiation factor 2 alpha subunit (eIF-2alpha)
VHKEARADEVKRKVAVKIQTYTELLDTVYENRDEKGLLDEDIRAAFYEIAAKNMKPKVFSVAYTAELSAINGKGNISLIRKAYGEVEKLGVSVIYEGAPHYKIIAKGPSYIEAENKIKAAQQALQKYAGVFLMTVKKTGAH